MSTTIIEIEKNGNESGMSVLRRFSRRVKESGILRHVRNIRYASRVPSKLSVKNRKLKTLKVQKEQARLRKLGKIA